VDPAQESETARRYAALMRRKGAIQLAVIGVIVATVGSLLWWLGQDDYEAIARTPGTIRTIAEFPDMQVDNPQPDSWEVIVELDTGEEIQMSFDLVPSIGTRVCVETRQYDFTRRFVFSGFMNNLETLEQQCSLPKH
jgi:hypothetical protein